MEKSFKECPICECPFKFCQCIFSGSTHPDRHLQTEVVEQHLYLLNKKQIKHLMYLQKYWRISYSDKERKQIYLKLIRKARFNNSRRFRLLFPLFRVTVQHENLDFLTNLIVKLGGKKNHANFYDLPY
ncbi:MAG: hypothetical protein WC292_00380 [Clostridia bacterium]